MLFQKITLYHCLSFSRASLRRASLEYFVFACRGSQFTFHNCSAAIQTQALSILSDIVTPKNVFPSIADAILEPFWIIDQQFQLNGNHELNSNIETRWMTLPANHIVLMMPLRGDRSTDLLIYFESMHAQWKNKYILWDYYFSLFHGENWLIKVPKFTFTCTCTHFYVFFVAFELLVHSVRKKAKFSSLFPPKFKRMQQNEFSFERGTFANNDSLLCS